MTHTAEPMTLKSLSGEMRNAVSLSERPTFAQIDMWADAIDAELAKQREVSL